MSDAALVGAETPITKSQFARNRNISAPRVSQYIDEGKIDGAALVGKGRDQKIVESIACQQLKERLNTSQSLGLNGLATRLDATAPAEPAPPPAPSPSGQVLPFAPPAPKNDTLADQIARERLEQIQRANRREAVAEAADAGRLTDATLASQMTGRIAAQMITVFEGSLSDLAAAIATKFELPQRDVMHLLRGEFRKVRASAAALMRRQAEALPMTVPIEIEAATDDSSDHERGTAGDGSDGAGVGAAAGS